jgi:NADH-quinone oxidoreductase subunit F
VVNNVETFTNVPLILTKGADWYMSLGTEDTAGVKVFSLSGCVNKPGNYELPFGTTFRELIFKHGGGIANGNNIKAIMPAGASSATLVATEEVLDTPMDYSSVRGAGAELGSASIIVVDDSFTMDWVINKTIHFFRHESCGKCTPCRDGNYWMQHLTERIYQGEASHNDIVLLDSVARQIQNKCLCALGEFSIQAVMTSIERFGEDFEAKVKA